VLSSERVRDVPYKAALLALLRQLDATNRHAERLIHEIESLLASQEQHDEHVPSARSDGELLRQGDKVPR
jgi:hypothetical protein